MGNADLPTRGGARVLSTVEKAAMSAWELKWARSGGRLDLQVNSGSGVCFFIMGNTGLPSPTLARRRVRLWGVRCCQH